MKMHSHRTRILLKLPCLHGLRGYGDGVGDGGLLLQQRDGGSDWTSPLAKPLSFDALFG